MSGASTVIRKIGCKEKSEESVCAMQGVVQSGFGSWNTLQPVACLAAPCNFKHPVRQPLLMHFKPNMQAACGPAALVSHAACWQQPLKEL